MTTAHVAVRPGPLARFHDAVAIKDEDLARLRWVAVVALVALNIADLALTRKLLGMGGMEANPIMAPFIHGWSGVVIKLVLPVAIGYRHLRVPVNRGLVLGLCWMCVLYLGVVTWNSHLLANPQLLG
ncbi:MAG: DUF5658 family protein [Acidimicrobiales bacterium]|nr:DUF5658 family protein [Acidimicrobiales bacterium]